MKWLQLLQTCKGKCFEEIYANKFESLDQMDKFLENVIYQQWLKKT